MNYFIKHWQGKLTLTVSFFVNMVLLSVLFASVINAFIANKLFGYYILLYPIAFLIGIWGVVGSWESANYNIENYDKVSNLTRPLSRIVQFFCLAWVISLLMSLETYFIVLEKYFTK